MELKVLDQISKDKMLQELQAEQEKIAVETKWLIFYIGKKRYAVKEVEVRNILKSVILHQFPFAPDFIDGVIVFHERIYAVVNYQKMIHDGIESENENYLYIVFKYEKKDFAIKVSGIEDFYTIQDENFSEDLCDDDVEFVKGSIVFCEEKIPVLDIDAISQNIVSSCKKG